MGSDWLSLEMPQSPGSRKECRTRLALFVMAHLLIESFVLALGYMQIFLSLMFVGLMQREAIDNQGRYQLLDFGFASNGVLTVNVTVLTNATGDTAGKMAFFLIKTWDDTFNISPKLRLTYCHENVDVMLNIEPCQFAMVFLFDLDERVVNVKKGDYLRHLSIYQSANYTGLNNSLDFYDDMLETTTRSPSSQSNNSTAHIGITDTARPKLSLVDESFPLHFRPLGSYNALFQVRFNDEETEGQYVLLYKKLTPSWTGQRVNLTVETLARNVDSYLSAGQRHLSSVYATFFALYFFLGCSSVALSRNSAHKTTVIKTHYLLISLTFIKCASVVAQYMNYHLLGIYGYQQQSVRLINGIMHVLTDSLFFVSVVLMHIRWGMSQQTLTTCATITLIVGVPLQILTSVLQHHLTQPSGLVVLPNNVSLSEGVIFLDLACVCFMLFSGCICCQCCQPAEEHSNESRHVGESCPCNSPKHGEESIKFADEKLPDNLLCIVYRFSTTSMSLV